LILILPHYLDELGVWISFPIAEVLATLVTGYYLRREVKRTLVNSDEYAFTPLGPHAAAPSQ